MSDSTRPARLPAQLLTGVLFCLVGGFVAVSIVLSLRGQEPSGGLMTALVVELLLWLGPTAGLVLSLGLALLGALLIVRDSGLAAGRPLAALTLGAVGLAWVLGLWAAGGEIGALPALLVPGFFGQGLGLVLGSAFLWVGLSLLLSGGRRPRSSAAEAMQRIGLASRAESASGVSAAEAALLGNEPRAAAPRVVARREEPIPITQQTIRPFQPRKEVPEPARVRRVDAPAAPARPLQESLPSSASAPIRPVETPILAARVQTLITPAPTPEAPPPPSWEIEGEEAALPAAPAAEGETWGGDTAHLDVEDDLDGDETELEDEDENEDELDELDEEAELDTDQPLVEPPRGERTDPEPADEEQEAEPEIPRASWEQVGLFDEEEELEDEETRDEPAAPSELTPSFDFEAGQGPKVRAHEPESSEDPFALEPPVRTEPRARRPENGTQLEHEHDAPPRAAEPAARTAEFVLEPKSAPAPARAPRDAEGERWKELVFEAGCAILEQGRVAVSMLERRFGIDFDQSCRVLDELQQAGLIGPYMGGRTRDILLSREEWLAQAPHAS